MCYHLNQSYMQMLVILIIKEKMNTLISEELS